MSGYPKSKNKQTKKKPVGKYDSTLKGHMNSDSLVLESTKGAGRKKAPRPYMKETYA